MHIIGEKLLSLKGTYQIHNFIGAYWFEPKDLTKLEKAFKGYSTPQNIDDIQSIYGFLSLYFSGAIENREYTFYVGINKNNAQWSVTPFENDNAFTTVFLVKIEKTDTESTVTLYLGKLCV